MENLNYTNPYPPPPPDEPTISESGMMVDPYLVSRLPGANQYAGINVPDKAKKRKIGESEEGPPKKKRKMKRPKKKKDPHAPKKPQTAYLIFYREFVHEYK
eukprot:408792_1